MPYNTRRKSLSLPSLGIHIPVTQASRAAAAAAAAASRSSSTTSSASLKESSASRSRSQSMESHPAKKVKRSQSDVSSANAIALNQTPPASPSSHATNDGQMHRNIDLATINDDIVEAVVTQLERTANRPHLIKELALVLALQLKSVQNSANQCAIISSRLASYMKRPCWTAEAPCPISKELEPVHPRRTYYFLNTRPRQPLPDPSQSIALQTKPQPQPQPKPPKLDTHLLHDEPILTPSVSLTDDSGLDDIEIRKRDLSMSPEVDFSAPEFDFEDDLDLGMPATPIRLVSKSQARDYCDNRREIPCLEKDEREFTQTANVLQKRKWSDSLVSELTERVPSMEYALRDEGASQDRNFPSFTFLASPMIRPTASLIARKEDETEMWNKFSKMIEWNQGAESIEIDELDCLLDGC